MQMDSLVLCILIGGFVQDSLVQMQMDVVPNMLRLIVIMLRVHCILLIYSVVMVLMIHIISIDSP